MTCSICELPIKRGEDHRTKPRRHYICPSTGHRRLMEEQHGKARQDA